MEDKNIKKRADVDEMDQWKLSVIYENTEKWRTAFTDWQNFSKNLKSYEGRLSDVSILIEFWKYYEQVMREGERLFAFAFLKSSEDLSNSINQEMKTEITRAIDRVAETCSFVNPELLALSEEVWKKFLTDERLEPWKTQLQRLQRQRKHTLTTEQERIVASLMECSMFPEKTFRILNDVEMSFPEVLDENGNRSPLTHETLLVFLQSPDRTVRKNAFVNYYTEYEKRQRTLASLLEGNIRKDVILSNLRRFNNSLESALFYEEVPHVVYHNLMEVVKSSLPLLFRYYKLRRRLMGLDNLHFYDVYVPVVENCNVDYSWEDAVDLIAQSLAPLGSEYVETLVKGLTVDRCCDKYENQNKRAGAFSFPIYDSPSFILMNYKRSIIESVFTLAHEGGHSMHSLYSSKTQPYRYFDCPIFLAEIASTFNEQMLARHLYETAKDNITKAWIINRELESIRTTVFRQTMFAEFEYKAHSISEQNVPLTHSRFREIYREILETFFGTSVVIDDLLELECFRIPHFYSSFYVYKYATGMSAAISFVDSIRTGGATQRDAYLNFLKSGGSKDPITTLREAGLDMESVKPIQAAMNRFEQLLNQLESLLDNQLPKAK